MKKINILLIWIFCVSLIICGICVYFDSQLPKEPMIQDNTVYDEIGYKIQTPFIPVIILNNTDTFSTIQEAIDSASTGSTISLGQGIYKDYNVCFNKDSTKVIFELSDDRIIERKFIKNQP